MDAETKTCSKCGVVKPVADFYIRNTICKSCCCAAAKEWQKSNPEKVSAAKKAYRKAHPEQDKAYRETNAERIKARMRVYHKTNPEPEKARARNKAWREANPEKERARKKDYRKSNQEKERSRLASRDKVRRESIHKIYVLDLITRYTPLKRADVPQSLIDLKREQVATLREVKRLIEVLKEKQDD